MGKGECVTLRTHPVEFPLDSIERTQCTESITRNAERVTLRTHPVEVYLLDPPQCTKGIAECVTLRTHPVEIYPLDPPNAPRE